MKTSVLRLTITLLLITAVVAAALAGVNAITNERIADIRTEKVRAALAAVLPDSESAQPVSEYPDDTGLVTAVYASPTGYAIQVAPMGFGGEIEMMVGVDRDGNVLRISIISHTETAGLGATAAANTAKGQTFRDQFIGASGSLSVTKDGGTVDALTSATITSRAVTEGVNAALTCAAGLA